MSVRETRIGGILAVLTYLGMTVVSSLDTSFETFAFVSVVKPIRAKRRCFYSTTAEGLFDKSDSRSSVTTTLSDLSEKESCLAHHINELCEKRNFPLEKVKNARDLASVRHSPVKPNRVIRLGRVSDASENDLSFLFGYADDHTEVQGQDARKTGLNIKTLVDLRSPTELKEDSNLERQDLYGDFVSMVWSERKNGLVRELSPGVSRLRRHSESGIFNHTKIAKAHIMDLVSGFKWGTQNSHPFPGNETSALHHFAATAAFIASSDGQDVESLPVFGSDDDDDDDDDDAEVYSFFSPPLEFSDVKQKRYVKKYPPGTLEQDETRRIRKERHFVSLMNELKYVRGTLSKLRKRDIAKVLVKSPGAIVSRRVRTRVKDMFLNEINEGGLPMLNDLLLHYGAPGIKHVLELCADKSRHPIAFYCTAGKDRTGMLTAIILTVLGIPDEDIVEDYSLSANVYAEMNDHSAMVGALSQRNLNPKTFLGAPPLVMRDTLENMRENYGSVEGYLDWIGFGPESREKLKIALLL